MGVYRVTDLHQGSHYLSSKAQNSFQKKTNGLSCEPLYYHVREAAGDNVFIREHGYMLITFIYHLKAVADPARNYEKQREEIKHGRNKKVK